MVKQQRWVETLKLINTKMLVTGGSIDMLNVGAATGSFTGSASGSVPVDIPVGDGYTLEYTNYAYDNILIDATGTEIHVAIKK